MAETDLTRRDVLLFGAASAAALLGSACGDAATSEAHQGAASSGGVASSTSSSSSSSSSTSSSGVVAQADGGSDDGATPACIETEDDPLGPYYRDGAPFKTTLIEPGMAGTKLTITGRIRSLGSCGGLAGAVIDAWQADDSGTYDNAGNRLRGRFRADANGSFVLETIVPGWYLNGASYRPRHVHVTVTADGHAPLTTQLYFAGDPYNATDSMFKPSLAMAVSDVAGGKAAAFDFVLRPA